MSIKITTWNVQNLTTSADLFDTKLEFIIETLQALESDVVALQEVLDLDALKALADGLGFEHFVATPDGRGNRVAFLARDALASDPKDIDQWQLAPGVEVRTVGSGGAIKTLPQFARPAFQITVQHDGREIEVITAHLKSKLLTFGGRFSTKDETLRARTAYFALERRAAEAASLRECVTDLLAAGHEVVLLGDLNDGPEAATTQILYGPPGSQPRGPDDVTRASGAFQREDQDDPRRLFNVTKLVPPDIRWTRRHNGQNELLDHILVSEGLMPRQGSLRRTPTLSILNGDVPNMVGEHPTTEGVNPDHAPVTAEFV